MTDPTTPRPGPLSGLRVLDFSRILSGPYAAMVLADMGAEVIKVEPLETGDETRNFPPFHGPLSHYYIALNRNKKSIALNLKSAEGVRIARDLARQSDIVLENFRPGVMDRLGLGQAVLAADNPRLIYCAISGFGADSPLGDMPAFDIVAQALSGVMSVNGEAGGGPSKLGLPLGDMAGSIFAVFGILAAVHQRNVSGKGGLVEIAMLDSLIAMLGYLAQIFFITGQPPRPVGTKHHSIVPYGAFPTQDGHVIVACLTEKFWRNFAACLDMPELADDHRFCIYANRLANRDQLEALIDQRMRGRDTAFWLERLDAFDVPHAPILDVGQALEQAHVAVRGLVETVSHPALGEMKVVRGPIRFDGHGPAPVTPPSLLGQETAEVLADRLSLTPSQIRELQGRGVLGGVCPAVEESPA